MNVSAFVLAGGRSSRMGADKAQLRVGDDTFLSLALRNASAVCESPVVVGEAARYAAFGPIVEDRIPGCGPLGGIHAALQSTETALSLVLSVDLPLMQSAFLRWLVDEASRGRQLATVPQWGGRTQPLCAVYRPEILPVVENALRARRYKVDRIFAEAPTRFVSDDEIRSAGFDGDIFRNVNTPEEYEWVKARFANGPAALVEDSQV